MALTVSFKVQPMTPTGSSQVIHDSSLTRSTAYYYQNEEHNPKEEKQNVYKIVGATPQAPAPLEPWRSILAQEFE